jgi:uncharacterized iron-regulated protein
MNARSIRLTLGAALLFAATAYAQTSPHNNSGYTPQRVYHSDEKRFSDFEAMLADLARADVVFVGEQHDDPNTHRLERAILEGLARRRQGVIVALEMFERDVQPPLDDYLAGKISEDEFLKAARPWPRYASDYRPLIEFARAHRWPVVAGNVPRRYASQVAKSGLAALDALPGSERQLIAAQIKCPLDDYYQRFAESMNSHPVPQAPGQAAPPPAEQRAMVERFYYAQCIKDETMAESIARAREGAGEPSPLIVHFNGAFHSDYQLGAAARTRQRLRQAKVLVVSVVPVDDLDAVKPNEYRQRGDYVIFTLRPSPVKASRN